MFSSELNLINTTNKVFIFNKHPGCYTSRSHCGISGTHEHTGVSTDTTRTHLSAKEFASLGTKHIFTLAKDLHSSQHSCQIPATFDRSGESSFSIFIRTELSHSNKCSAAPSAERDIDRLWPRAPPQSEHHGWVHTILIQQPKQHHHDYELPPHLHLGLRNN
jgi:hypothetical protein